MEGMSWAFNGRVKRLKDQYWPKRKKLSVGRVKGALTRRKQRWTLAAKLPKHGVGAEIGVETGTFSAQLLLLTRAKRLHLIDPWEQKRDPTNKGRRAWPGGDVLHDRVCRRFAAKIKRGTVVVHRCGSAEAAAMLEALDWVYVDGDHTYRGAKEDLTNYYALLKPGGTLAGDDYGMRGRAYGDGVREAVDEFVQAHSCALQVSGHQFAITKPA
jgi:hypothetical protein